jgi:hypothetical protein
VVVALIDASFDQHLDSSLYPFDRHDLRIAFQPLRPASQVVLSPAPTSTGFATDFFSIGWRVGAARLETGEHRAGTDFGTGDDAYRHYSRASITLPVARQLGLVGLGHFAGFAVAIVIALGSFSIPPTHFSVRMSLFGSAVFAGIGNRYLLNDRIGIGPASALSETASTVAFLCAGIALVSAVIDERHRDTGKRWIAVWADRCGLALCSMLGAFALARVLWAATRI